MRWNRRYSLKSYVRSSLWVVPFIAIPIEIMASRAIHWLDRQLGWTLLNFTHQGAQALLETIVTITLSFFVFTFGSLLVAIQIASGQLTPRIIATTLLRDDFVRYAVGLFLFTLLFALRAQGQMVTDVHQTVIFVTAVLGVLCLAAFLYFIDHAARLLRPISVLQSVARTGVAVIDGVYPNQPPTVESGRAPSLAPGQSRSAPDRVVYHEGVSEIVLAVNVGFLVAEAQKADAVIELAPQVGDFVAADEPLLKIYGNHSAIDETVIRSAVAFGPERTMEQDPTFAFRIVVDIALRALSAAINDPTTAVLAIDQLHRLLRMVGKRNLRTDQVADASGQLRVVLRTPNWEDFVNLSFNEIRRCGAGSTQVARRLRSMVENLIQTLPEIRHAALLEQLSLLDRDVQKNFAWPEDLALARVADPQGLGGHSQLVA